MGLFSPLVSETAHELWEPSNPLQSARSWVQHSCIYLGIPWEVTCISWLSLIIHVSLGFLVGLPHHTSYVYFPCWNPLFGLVSLVACLLCVSSSLYSLLPTAVSHSPGAALLQHCFSLSVSEHCLSHRHPPHAISIAFSWQLCRCKGSQQATSTSYFSCLHICKLCWNCSRKYLPDSICKVSASVTMLFLKVTFQVGKADGTTCWQRMGSFLASLAATLMLIWPLSELIKLLTYKNSKHIKRWIDFFCFLLHLRELNQLTGGWNEQQSQWKEEEGTTVLGGGDVRVRDRGKERELPLQRQVAVEDQ